MTNTGRRRFPLFELTLIVIICGCTARILTVRAEPPWFRRACLSNLKQTNIAVALYTSDYDERFPDRDRWMNQLNPYTKNDYLNACPMIGMKGSYGHAFNSWLSPRLLSSLVSPAGVPQVYDSLNLAWNASDPFTSLPPMSPSAASSRRSVGFADGHVRWVGAETPGWKP